jgi:paired small multidrug resistance pump
LRLLSFALAMVMAGSAKHASSGEEESKPWREFVSLFLRINMQKGEKGKKMNKTWMLVVVIAMFEAVWVSGLKYADSLLEWIGTAVVIAISFVGLIGASKKLPASTVYAVFVGLGTASTVIAEMAFFGEPFRWSKVLLIGLLIVGVIGLKLVTAEHSGSADQEGDAA